MENPRNTIYGTGVVTTTTSAPYQKQQPGLCSLLQLSSMTAGALIFISGGMHLAQGMGWSDISVTGTMGHFHYCWSVAVIVGTVMSLPLGNILPKKCLMAASSLLLLVGGITYISDPTNPDSLVAGRYLNGVGVGLAIVPFLCHISEISRISHRGVCLGIEQFCLTLGIAIQMIYTSQWNVRSDFSVNRLHGILDIILSVGAAASLVYFIESPVDCIRRGDDAAALNILARLQIPPGLSMETKVLLEEHKDYVRKQENFSMVECLKRSLFPLVKMVFFRSMILAFTCSICLTGALQFSMLVNRASWPPAVAACLRIFGGCLTLMIVDNFGRKIPSLIWAFCMGGLLIGIASIFNSSLNLLNSHKMSTVTSICLVIEFFAGLFSPNTSVYMGEAFPLKIRTYLMGLCVIIEQIIHIIVISCAHPLGNDGTLMAEGIMILVATACFCVTMPETMRTTLKEAQDRFARLLNLEIF